MEIANFNNKELEYKSNEYVLEEGCYKTDNLLKSNTLIGLKYKASVLENKVTYLAMMKLQNNEYVKKSDGIYVTLTSSELSRFIRTKKGTRNNSLYTNLKYVAKSMVGNFLGTVDDKNKTFSFITLINKAQYENEKFTIRFASELENVLIDVRENFTNIPQKIVYNMHTQYSFALYQLLKSRCYRSRYEIGPENGPFQIIMGISELKLNMGVVDSNEPSIKEILIRSNCTEEEYEEAINKCKNKKYDSWTDFNKRCLAPTIEELNNISDLYIEYLPNKGGRGGKVKGVVFNIWKNKNSSEIEENETKEEKREISEEEKTLLLMEYYGKYFIELNIKPEEGKAICEAADYDVVKIEKAIKIFKDSPGINDTVGWLIAAIKNNYKEPVKKETSFNSFSREHTEEEKELERKLLGE